MTARGRAAVLRTFGVFAAGTLLALSLTACGGGAEEPTPTPVVPTPGATPSPTIVVPEPSATPSPTPTWEDQWDILAAEALGIMNSRSITSLFVVDDDRPVGIIHIHDCLRAGIA